MHTTKFSLIIIALVLASLACSLNINLPITTDVKTGASRTDEINILPLDSIGEVAQLTLGFGAGEMNLSPGTADSLLVGETTYNVDDLKPKIEINGESIKVETGNLNIDGIPNFGERVKNVWDLYLGTDPIDLTIKAGAYVGDFELGGLSLTDLHISDGAADVSVNFGQPNLAEMETLRYETGASNIKLSNLLNANFDTMIFQSGAGNYELDFSGVAQRNAAVFIETGLSSLTIFVPETTNARLTVEGGLASITSRGSWAQSGSEYRMNGDGPTLTITVEMNAGNLILDTP